MHNQKKDNNKLKKKQKTQNCQKIKLWKSNNHGVKEKTFRLVGEAETGSQGGEEASSWRTRQSHISRQLNREEPLGSETDHTGHGSSAGKESLKNLWL